MPPKANPPPPRRPNPLKDRPPIKAPPPIIRQNTPAKAPRQRICPNKYCNSLSIEEGICTECGTILEESNIVAEVSFGETTSGAAVVQGTYISADQGGAASGGVGGRIGGEGQNQREKTLREGRGIMMQMSAQLNISQNAVEAGHQIFKLAATANFIQGRRLDMVSIVCLYSACRKTRPCRIMLIDFADKIQVNVFKLGATFKALHKAIPIAKDGIMPILPEDLIHRFAQRLEFGDLCDKVAEDAVRMVKRMSLDWMVMGRRPSGVCGACLILAARMNNFRRTITEVVYIVKVTTATIQKRLEEFKLTPSGALTVEEFLHNEFLESAHDPPSFYEKTEEFQKTIKRRKRKGHDAIGDGDGSGSEIGESGSPNKRQKTATPGSEQPAQQVELRRDADGFVIPPVPTPYNNNSATSNDPESAIDPALRSTGAEANNAIDPTLQTNSSQAGLSQGNSATDRTLQWTESASSQAQAENGSIPPSQSTNTEFQVPSNATNPGQLSTPPQTQSSRTPLPTAASNNGAQSNITPPETQASNNPSNETQSVNSPVDPELGETLDEATETTFEKLVAQFGDVDDVEDEEVEEVDLTGPKLGRRGPDHRPIRVDEAWSSIEEELEAEISEMINDPNTIDHAQRYALAKRRAAAHMLVAEKNRPQKEVSMDVHIGEDEFKDDPEVVNCLLSPEDVARKEKLWVNENKHWLRKQQIREWQRRQAENGPPKAKRNRKKKPRMGENQTSAASTPGEAAASAVKRHAFSRKINYDAIKGMFEKTGMGNSLGSAGTSRVASRAGSDFDGSDTASRASSVALSAGGDENPEAAPSPAKSLDIFAEPAYLKPRKRRPKAASAASTPARGRTSASPVAIAPRPSAEPSTPAPEDEDEEINDFDYVKPTEDGARAPARREEEEEAEDWRVALKQLGAEGADDQDDEGDYDDMGDIEPGGLGVDDASEAGGFDGDEDMDMEDF